VVVVAAALVIGGLALAGSGSGGGPHPQRAASRPPAPVRPAGATEPGGADARLARDASSAEMRRLIALGRPIFCAGRTGDEVALTFDDGPGPYTRLVLAKLRKHHIRATFFVVGRNISLVPGATRREQAIGAVGDHTYTHPLLTSLPPAEAEREIVRTQVALEHASGAPVVLFRPPYGGHDAAIDGIARAHGLLEVLWSVDSADSLGADYLQIERNVIAGLHPGAIILMHENHGQTVRALLGIFAALARRHMRAVSVPQLLTDDPPSVAAVRSDGSDCDVPSASLGKGD